MFIKKLTKEILDIKSIEDFFLIKKEYNQKQKLSYTCKQCGKFSIKNIWKITNLYNTVGFDWLCRKCQTKNTNLKKYGVAHPRQLESVKEKFKQTCFEKYGVDHPNKDRLIQTKSKNTNLEKYGVENVSRLQSIKEKKKETCLKHYGVENPNQYEKVREKIKQTCLKKYGVENPSQVQSVKEKKKQIMLKTYGKQHIGWRYFFDNEQFDSSWELAVWVWAKDNEKEFGKVVREPIVLKYEFEGKEHSYFPDFQIGDKLVEIKGNHFFKKDGTMQHPFDHNQDNLFEAKHQCGLKNGVEFWSEKEMKPILKYIETKYGKGYLNQFKT